MELDDFLKLEEKIKGLVKNLKQLKEENRKLKSEIEKLLEESSLNNSERTEIKKKVAALIELIDSLEKVEKEKA
jgi:cell division protein FtsB